MDPKCSPKGALEASKRPLGAEISFRMLFGFILDPLKSSKMELKFDQKSSADLRVSFWLFGSLWGSFGVRFGGHFGSHNRFGKGSENEAKFATILKRFKSGQGCRAQAPLGSGRTAGEG